MYQFVILDFFCIAPEGAEKERETEMSVAGSGFQAKKQGKKWLIIRKWSQSNRQDMKRAPK